jgi:hypothetical protein
MDTARWMSGLSGDTPLCKVVMPGSHDAGVYGNAVVAPVLGGVGGKQVTGQALQPGTRAGTKARGDTPVHTRWCQPEWAICQHTNLKGQAECGSRFFDLRIYVKDEWLRPGNLWREGKLIKKDLRAGHYTAYEGGSWKEPTFGGYGGSLISLVKDAVEFVKGYSTEFLILRFSHVQNHERVRNGIKAQLEAMNAFTNKHVYVGEDDNLGAVKIKRLRNKVVMVFDSQFNSVRHHGYKKWMVPWAKLEDCKKTTGLHTCGVFANKKDINQVHAKEKQAVKDHVANCLQQKTSPSHLCFVYWQQTSPKTSIPPENVEEMTTATQDSAHSRLPQFVSELMYQWGKSAQTEYGQPPANVISHDFVKPGTCESIIKMNQALWTNDERSAYDAGKKHQATTASTSPPRRG